MLLSTHHCVFVLTILLCLAQKQSCKDDDEEEESLPVPRTDPIRSPAAADITWTNDTTGKAIK